MNNRIFKNIDFSTIIGVTLSILVIFYAISLSGNYKAFMDIPSFFIVFIGTLLITIACFSFEEVAMSYYKIFSMIMFAHIDPKEAALESLDIAKEARTKGTNELEEIFEKSSPAPIIKNGIMMINDNDPANKIEKIFSQQIYSEIEVESRMISILRKSAEIAPAMGLMGTLIGLVQMLSSLDDVSKIGPAMALSLLTTFYGTLLAYVFFFPLASKIERNSKDKAIASKIYLQTIISIQSKENPRLLETEINSLLSDSKSIKYFDD